MCFGGGMVDNQGSWKGEGAGSKAQVNGSALGGSNNSSIATGEREDGYMCAWSQEDEGLPVAFFLFFCRIGSEVIFFENKVRESRGEGGKGEVLK